MDESERRTESGWEQRCYAGFVRFLEAIAAGSAGAELIRRDGVVASVAPASPERSLFNSVCFSDPAALRESVEELRKSYGAAGVNAWTVWVPDGDEETAEMLAGLGHRLDGSPRQMLLDLGDVPRPGGELEPIRSLDWEDLCAINDAAYDYEEGTFRAGLGRRPDPAFRAYGARHNGWLASVLATLVHDGDCEVTAVATLPEARGNRIASRLLHLALADARDQGCEISTLQASRMGRSVYERLGYRDQGGLQMWEHRVFPS
jgi:GNAT superfamily N-acetyltransferase